MKQYISDTRQFSIEYHLATHIPEESPANAKSFTWRITQRFEFQQRAVITMEVKIHRRTEDKTFADMWDRYFWLHFLVLVTSLFSLILGTKYVLEIQQLYSRMRRSLSSTPGESSLMTQGRRTSQINGYMKIKKQNTEYLENNLGISPTKSKVNEESKLASSAGRINTSSEGTRLARRKNSAILESQERFKEVSSLEGLDWG